MSGPRTRLQSRAVNDATFPPASRRSDLLALALLFLIATISFADVLFGVNQLYMRDLTRYFDEASQIGFWRSVRYGLEILKTMVLYKLHKKKIWSHRIFREPQRPLAAVSA